MNSTVKVAVVTPIPAPYRIPLFNGLAAEPWIDLEVLFCAAFAKSREWLFPSNIDFHYDILPGPSIWLGGFRGATLSVKPTLLYQLWRRKPDVVITWEFSLQTVQVKLYSTLRNTPYLVFSEGTVFSENYLFARMKSPLRRWLTKRASCLVAANNAAKEYLIYLGARPEDVFIGLQTLDVEEFAKESDQERLRKAEIKRELGLEGMVILFCSKLIKRKGTIYLLKAFEKVVARKPNVNLLIVGSGTEERALRSYCDSRGISNVLFAGFKQPEELPTYYGIADLFVFPTLLDLAPLVIREALSASLPVVCSKYGCELITHGENGFIVNPYDIEMMAGAILQIMEDSELRAEMSANARASCRDFTMDKSVQRFVDAIRYALEQKGAACPAIE